jgi:hypothetical protein
VGLVLGVLLLLGWGEGPASQVCWGQDFLLEKTLWGYRAATGRAFELPCPFSKREVSLGPERGSVHSLPSELATSRKQMGKCRLPTLPSSLPLLPFLPQYGLVGGLFGALP